jgi:type I restriction enzyme M protein
MSNLTPVIKSIQDVMRQDSGVDGDAQRISQLTWLLFLKVFDALEEELELTRDGYRSPIPEPMRWRAWAADAEGITGDELLSFVNNELFVTLKNLPADPVRNSRAYVVRGVFEDAYNYMKSGQLLRQVINKLNAIDFNRQSERHQFNDLYEKILRDLQSAGNAGEFYTPRAVTQFMVDMLNPQLGEQVLDPATGTGGFLVCAIEHLRKPGAQRRAAGPAAGQRAGRGEEAAAAHALRHQHAAARHRGAQPHPPRQHPGPPAARLHGRRPRRRGADQPALRRHRRAGHRGRLPRRCAHQGNRRPVPGADQAHPEINGRAAVVLPDGTLFGEGVKTRIKQQLLEECDLHTIVRLPNGVFAPYTGIKTNLLFFTKGRPTEHIWYYEHPYPAGVKNYNKTKPIRIEEFDAEKAWWGSEADGFAARVENERAWKVGIEAIRAANYNLDQKNPHAAEAVSHDPDELLREYARLQGEAQALRSQLMVILATSLGARV